MSWIADESQLGGLSADAKSTVFSVGNGEQCVRGTAADAFAAAGPPYPYRGSYLAGLYTRSGWNLDYLMGGPDWTAAAVKVGGEHPRQKASRMRLDLQRGVLTDHAEMEGGGARVEYIEERFISWTPLGACCQRLTLRSPAGTAHVELTAGIDGDIRNNPSKEYKPGNPRNCDHRGVKLSTIEEATAADGLIRVVLKARSTRHRVRSIGVVRQVSGPAADAASSVVNGFACTRFTATIPKGEALVIEKIVLTDWYSPGVDAFPDELDRTVQVRGRTFAAELDAHKEESSGFWRLADVRIEGDDFSQLAVRFALWSTRIAAPLRSDASIGPKNLTGDWYRGGVMWDMDMYQLPVLSAIDPARGRNHIRYRHRRLDPMRTIARMDGWDGAHSPGASYETGEMRSVRVGGIRGQQLHIDLAMSWGVLHAYFLHGDAGELIRGGGLEMLLELGRFWLSVIPDAEADGLYHVRNICGPDELHPGVDDNTYTNIFSAWTLAATAEVLRRAAEEHPEAVAALRRRCGWSDADSARARDIASRMFTPKLPDGSPAPFANFEAQPEANAAIRNKWWAGDNTHKQADIVMLSQVLPRETDPAWLAAAYDANVPLCTQTSSLSPGTHVIAAVQLRRLRDAERFWRLAAGMDLADSFGNAAHGIHGAGQGGVWLGAVHGFGGMRAGIDGLEIDPLLPPFWRRLEYAVLYRGQVLSIDVEPGSFTVTNTGTAEVTVTLGGKQTAIAPASSVRTPIAAKWQRPRLRAALLAVDGLLNDATTLGRLAAELKAAGIRTAAVSARKLLPAALEQAGLAGAFSAIMDGTMLTEPPPQPQAFLLAANRCRSLPWECVAIAASQADVEAAKRGGATTIGVNGFTGGQADIRKFADLTMDVLKRTFEQRENPIDPFLELNIAKMRTELTG